MIFLGGTLAQPFGDPKGWLQSAFNSGHHGGTQADFGAFNMGKGHHQCVTALE
jgi:hypothetical protein